ncbi:hypothetical protein Vafri_15968, partial [Volvox africanus]
LLPGIPQHLDEAAVHSVMTGKLGGAMMFYRAEVDEERLSSEGYSRARSRHSFYFLVWYTEGDESRPETKPYIGVVRTFVKLPAVPAERDTQRQERHELRFLLVCLLKVEKVGHMYIARQGLSGPGWPLYAMPFSVLRGRQWRRCVAALDSSGASAASCHTQPCPSTDAYIPSSTWGLCG